MPRPSARRRTHPLLPVLLAAAALAGACSSGAGDRLVLAEGTIGQRGSTPLWAVEPGDRPGAENRVADAATQPLGIRSVTDGGALWTNRIAREWSGGALMAYGGEAGARVTAGAPGGRPATVAAGAGRLDTVVLRRGVFVASADGCSLAQEPERGATVGRGQCSISEDERWVASWQAGRPGLEVRDLRDDGVVRVGGGEVVGATALGRDARVLAAQETGGAVVLRVLDAVDGSTVARVGRFEAVQLAPAVQGATGFVALVQEDGGRALLHVDTDGRRQVIARGAGVVPVTYGEEVVYLDLGTGGPGGESLWRWEPGDEEPELLLRGRLGAAALDGGSVVALRERPGRVEFWRQTAQGRLEESVVLRTDTSTPLTVERTLVHGDEVMMQVTGAAGTSLVVVDTHGGEGRVPVANWARLALASVDPDGSALLIGSRRDPAARRQTLVHVPAGKEDGEVRARLVEPGFTLLHDGTIYTTVLAGDRPQVRSITARGRVEAEVLWQDKQLVGATWPEQGGATESVMLTRALLTAPPTGGGAAGPSPAPAP